MQSAAAEIRRGKKEEKKERKIETTGHKYNGLPYYRAAIINVLRLNLIVANEPCAVSTAATPARSTRIYID